jgi:hypothetical protein
MDEKRRIEITRLASWIGGEDEEEEELSACCGAPFYDDTDVCRRCGEHG